MRLRRFVSALIVALFSLQTLQFTARADEGMWPFNNVPRAEIKKKYGFDVTDEWLRKRRTFWTNSEFKWILVRPPGS